jgi:polygalacturonase
MRFKLNISVATIALAALITFQNIKPAYAGHHALPAAFDNVRTFGAMGDGVTDDTAAIQNAANDALASHRVLLFPPGTYLHAGICKLQ